MGGGSATAYLLWAILASMFLVFLLFHLWNYDRFNCLRWNAGRQPGAFKRVMTYSYLGTVPLLVAFATSITALKFREGFIITPDGQVFPRPFSLWHLVSRRWILPLFFTLSIAWSLELVTHFEELTFWVFLMNQGPSKREWFESWEFRIWTLGSTTALLIMPVTVLMTRRNVDTCLAYVFVVGSVAGTSTTILFLYVLARFPGFIRHVKAEGAEPEVVHRLATFYELNRIRVVFRFLFTVPLLALGVDGLVAPHVIARNSFATDFLLILGGIGSLVSSGITLLIFFPRPLTRDMDHDTQAQPMRIKTPPPTGDHHCNPHPTSPKSVVSEPPINTYRLSHSASTPSVDMSRFPSRLANSNCGDISPTSGVETFAASSRQSPAPPQTDRAHLMLRASLATPSSHGTVYEPERDVFVRRRRYSDGHIIFDRAVQPLTGSSCVSSAGSRQNSTPLRLHPYLINFTSPIDLMDEGNDHEIDYIYCPA